MNNADLADAHDLILKADNSAIAAMAARILGQEANRTARAMVDPQFDIMGTADAARSVVQLRALADELKRRLQ
jgi:hypothetical protein